MSIVVERRPEVGTASYQGMSEPDAPLSTRARRYVTHVLVVAKRGLINTMRTPEALIDVTAQPIIFLLMFTYIFGGAIAGGSQHDYMQFLLPAMLGMLIAMASVAIGQNLNEDIEKGIFDRFRALPISRSVPLIGAVVADVARYLILCAITLGMATLLGFRIETGALAAIAGIGLAIGFALCFAWVSVWVGMIVRTPGAVQGTMFAFVMPLSFVSNAFVPTGTMPSWLQPVADNNPISHLATTMRGLWVGGPVAHDLWWTLGWMGALLVVFAPLAIRRYRKRA